MWQISSTRSFTTADCLRRSRSSSKNPPAERRLKKATPSNHASTSQGRASSEGVLKDRSRGDRPREDPPREDGCAKPLAASPPLAVDQDAAASGDDFAASATPECC